MQDFFDIALIVTTMPDSISKADLLAGKSALDKNGFAVQVSDPAPIMGQAIDVGTAGL